MSVINKTILSLFTVLVLCNQAFAKESQGLKPYWKPITDLTAEAVKAASGVLLCAGGFDSKGEPYIGDARGLEDEDGFSPVCKYSQLVLGKVSSKKQFDGSNSEWLDITYDQLLLWLEAETRQEEGKNGEVYFTFTYPELTGSVSVTQVAISSGQSPDPISDHAGDVSMCAQWTGRTELAFGHEITSEGGQKICELSIKAKYKKATWHEGYYKIDKKGWSAKKPHLGGFCKATQIGKMSKELCAKIAREKDAKGFCYDGGTCGLITEVMNINDDGGGSNVCYLRNDIKVGDVEEACWGY